MPPRNQKQVVGGIENMAGKAVRRVAEDYNAEIVRPMVDAFKAAKSPEGLLRRLNPAMLRRMDTNKTETAIAETQVQGALIGRTTALPKERQTKRRG